MMTLFRRSSSSDESSSESPSESWIDDAVAALRGFGANGDVEGVFVIGVGPGTFCFASLGDVLPGDIAYMAKSMLKLVWEQVALGSKDRIARGWDRHLAVPRSQSLPDVLRGLLTRPVSSGRHRQATGQHAAERAGQYEQ